MRNRVQGKLVRTVETEIRKVVMDGGFKVCYFAKFGPFVKSFEGMARFDNGMNHNQEAYDDAVDWINERKRGLTEYMPNVRFR